MAFTNLRGIVENRSARRFLPEIGQTETIELRFAMLLISVRRMLALNEMDAEIVSEQRTEVTDGDGRARDDTGVRPGRLASG
jgi:hypothetical protein